MIRWLGGLTGGALAIGAIVWLAGVPSIVERAEPEPLPASPIPAAAPAQAPEPEPLPAEQPVELPASPPAVKPVEQPEPDPEPVVPPQAPVNSIEPPRWHAFWSPFRSQIAANGFISRLQSVTALDYRVVTIKPGVYEVAFAYQDDTEVAENLAQIAAATGLDVPES